MVAEESLQLSPLCGSGLLDTRNGPDIPDEVIEAVDNGDLILFCGAGVSVGAGLPCSQQLVTRIYDGLNIRHHLSKEHAGDEWTEFDKCNYDRLFSRLEQRMSRGTVRQHVIAELREGDWADLSTHSALLRLAGASKGRCRLVTSNFDNCFERCASTTDARGIRFDAAPALPYPKRDRWRSVVHLRGHIDEEKDPDGEELVLSTPDFGAAYLTEGWAARFVTELFRRFKILFVGYSANDPVVRYALQALKHEPERDFGGETRLFALAGATAERYAAIKQQWEEKGAHAIVYDERNAHELLRMSLTKWAQYAGREIEGREAVVRENVSQRPTDKYRTETSASQVLWAIKEDSGTVARFFASEDHPAPPVEWLRVFEEEGLLQLPVEKALGVVVWES